MKSVTYEVCVSFDVEGKSDSQVAEMIEVHHLKLQSVGSDEVVDSVCFLTECFEND